MHWIKMTLVPAILLVLAGCASNDIYRSAYEPCTVGPTQPCDEHSLQVHNSGKDNEYFLGFVEIDDQGQLRDRNQMQALLDALYLNASENSLLLTVFVHGWHHNASPGDPNIEGFKVNLEKLSAIETKLSQSLGRPPRKIAGVYIGWRGESIDLFPFNYATFWDRKSTAQDVGYLGVSELLVKLEEITNVRNSMTPPIKSRLVVLGHSFGGAVVFSATAQILASRFVDSQEGKGFSDTAKGFGDLVVLLNPAFEALRFAPFHNLAQARCSFFPEQVPRLAILTSEGDDATGILFPMGRVFSTIFETHEEIQRNDCRRPITIDEGEADRAAVGHFEPLISHTLKPLGQEKNLPIAEHQNMQNIWSGQSPGGSTQFGSTVLTHLNKTDPRNPYLNIRVDPEIIADHNDVFREQSMEFIRLLITLSTGD